MRFSSLVLRRFRLWPLLAVLSFLTLPALADFPSALVINGSIYAGYPSTDSLGQSCFEYDARSGVLLLYLDGSAYAGPDANSIFDEQGVPFHAGTWDGSTSVSMYYLSVAVPQLVPLPPNGVGSYGLSTSNAYVRNIAPIASGHLAGQLAVAYVGIPEGAFFTFSDFPASQYDHYQAGFGPVLMDASGGWPPSNIPGFPHALTVYGFSMPAVATDRSFTPQGFAQSCSYVGSGCSGGVDMQVPESGQASGTWWASGPEFNVSGVWDPATGTGLFDLASTTPLTGPRAISAYGALLTFRLNDSTGADYYVDDDGWNQVWISPNLTVTATTQRFDETGTYDPTFRLSPSPPWSWPP